MFCWSCGSPLRDAVTHCRHCGAPPVRTAGEDGFHALRVCMGCGYRGEGIPYFRRATHVALLVGATILTYAVGGVLYWAIKRKERVCPSCGISWKRSRPLGAAIGGAGDDAIAIESGTPTRRLTRRGTESGFDEPPLPSAGMGRRVVGVLLALLAVFFVGMGIAEMMPVLAAVALPFGLSGAAAFAWGWRARQGRREAVLRRLQRRVLRLARSRGGTLTATDVATAFDLTLEGAERILLSLDDGFRIRSDVTPEGLLIFEFPEIRLSPRNESEKRGALGPPALEPKPHERGGSSETDASSSKGRSEGGDRVGG